MILIEQFIFIKSFYILNGLGHKLVAQNCDCVDQIAWERNRLFVWPMNWMDVWLLARAYLGGTKWNWVQCEHEMLSKNRNFTFHVALFVPFS